MIYTFLKLIYLKTLVCKKNSIQENNIQNGQKLFTIYFNFLNME